MASFRRHDSPVQDRIPKEEMVVSVLLLVPLGMHCNRLASEDEGDRREGELPRLPAGAGRLHLHEAWD